MGEQAQGSGTGGDSGGGSSFSKVVKIALLVFVLVLGGIAVTAFLVGEEEALPLDYEGFD